MSNTTGKLDKLIEDKVDQKIKDFARNISNQVKDFLKENGDYSGDYLYQAQSFRLHNSHFEPQDYAHRSVNDFFNNLKCGLDLTIKDRMILRETKDLLAKVSLLS